MDIKLKKGEKGKGLLGKDMNHGRRDEKDYTL